MRWDKADLNGDSELSTEEFRAFLHPEDAPHMHDIIIDVRSAAHVCNSLPVQSKRICVAMLQETSEDIDKDGDGFISLAEYLGKFSVNNFDFFIICICYTYGISSKQNLIVFFLHVFRFCRFLIDLNE